MQDQSQYIRILLTLSCQIPYTFLSRIFFEYYITMPIIPFTFVVVPIQISQTTFITDWDG